MFCLFLIFKLVLTEQKMLHKSIRSACTECKSTALPRTDCILHLERQEREAGEGRVFPILPQTQNRTRLLFNTCNPPFQTQLKWSCKFCMDTCSMCKPAIPQGKEQHYTHPLPGHLHLHTRVGNSSKAREKHIWVESQIYWAHGNKTRGQCNFYTLILGFLSHPLFTSDVMLFLISTVPKIKGLRSLLVAWVFCFN